MSKLKIRRLILFFGVFTGTVLVAQYANALGSDCFSQRDTLIEIAGDEQEILNLDKPDGGLPPLPEVLNIELLRTTRDVAELADGDGWTYAHHMDLAEWRGRMYAAWNMTPKDEDVPPLKVVYSTTENGTDWSKPADLFPRELAWACRFYFYHTRNDKMLTFCAARVSEGNVSEALKTVLLVREIKPNHELGEVFTLVGPNEKLPPYFETSADNAFVEACREAVNNNMLLEQQDYGMFLGDRKMEWHEKTPPFKGFYKFGKGFCFYKRADNKWIGLTKMGFATTSADEGKTWTEPVLPSSLVAGSAKVWGQQTRDNNYILSYNPDPKRAKRYPLVMVHGNDGIHFKEMRVVHGEHPPLRYPGKYKDFGYQYVRGVAAWSSDGTFPDKNSVWLIYSVHKEDIWLSRIPLPIKTDVAPCKMEDFQDVKTGAFVPGWNLYSPKWAPVKVVEEPGNTENHCLELRDADPTDYARAMRLFPLGKKISAEFSFKPDQIKSSFETEIQDEKGNVFFTLVFNEKGEVKAVSGSQEIKLDHYKTGKWFKFKLEMDVEKQIIKIACQKKKYSLPGTNSENNLKLQRLVFRTGPHREFGNTDKPVDGNDKPLSEPDIILIDNVSIQTK